LNQNREVYSLFYGLANFCAILGQIKTIFAYFLTNFYDLGQNLMVNWAS